MKLVLASANQGKLREMAELITPLGWEVTSQAEFNIEPAAETGSTFVENALLKARHVSQQTNLAALADDSGLVVPSLNGAPGIYSARFAGSHGDDEANNQALLKALKPGLNRQAYFFCAMVLMLYPDDPTPLIATARWHGTILDAPRGGNGFGYDPLFQIRGQDITSAQLPAVAKNKQSHRGQAIGNLLNQLKNLDLVSTC